MFAAGHGDRAELVRRGAELRHVALLNAPTVTAETSNDALAELFLAQPDLHAVAVMDAERPVGLINRAQFMNQYSQQVITACCKATAAPSTPNTARPWRKCPRPPTLPASPT